MGRGRGLVTVDGGLRVEEEEFSTFKEVGAAAGSFRRTRRITARRGGRGIEPEGLGISFSLGLEEKRFRSRLSILISWVLCSKEA